MKNKFVFLKYFSIIIISLILITNFYINIENVESKENENKKNFLNNFIVGLKVKFIDKRPILFKQPNINPPEDGYPIVFLFHGATQHAFSWFIGFNKWSRTQISFTKDILENGFFVVSFESKRPIRPGPRAWDAFEEDETINTDIIYTKNVISWLDNSTLSVDCDNIFCAGFSSGAFFCSRLAQSYGYSFKGVILNSGCNVNCINLTNMGPVFNCSKGFNISSFHPPTLLVHGEKDGLVPFECADSYYSDLLTNNIDVTTLFDENIGHIWLEKYNNDIIKWMLNKI